MGNPAFLFYLIVLLVAWESVCIRNAYADLPIESTLLYFKHLVLYGVDMNTSETRFAEVGDSLNIPSPRTIVNLSTTIPPVTIPQNVSGIPSCSLYMNNCENWEEERHKFLYRFRTHNSSAIYLIIVNYHYGVYSSYSFLNESFFPRFAHHFHFDFDVVYFGPRYNETVRILCNRLSNGGFYSYHTVNVALALFKDAAERPYAGYLLMNDDSYVDPQFLNSLNLNSSLSEPTKKYHNSSYWDWKIRSNSRGVRFPVALNRAIMLLIEDPEVNETCQFSNPDNTRRGFSDFFYIAAPDIDLFLKMSTVMYSQRVFLEMAVPTMMYCLTKETVIDCNHGMMPMRKTCVHMHPVKYSDRSMQQLALKRLEHVNMNRLPKRNW